MQYLRWFVVICLIIVLLLNLYKEKIVAIKNIKYIIGIVLFIIAVVAIVGVFMLKR